MATGAHDFVRPPPPSTPHSPAIRFSCGPATRGDESRADVRWVQAELFPSSPSIARRPQAGVDGEQATGGGKCDGGPAKRRWEWVRVTLDSRDEPKRCEVWPTILFDRT